MEQTTESTASGDFSRARIERLEAEELRAFAAAVGDHLPIELALRVEQLRAERLVLAGAELLPPARR